MFFWSVGESEVQNGLGHLTSFVLSLTRGKVSGAAVTPDLQWRSHRNLDLGTLSRTAFFYLGWNGGQVLAPAYHDLEWPHGHGLSGREKHSVFWKYQQACPKAPFRDGRLPQDEVKRAGMSTENVPL